MTASLRTFRDAQRFMESRLGPMSRAERVLTETLDARLRRIQVEHIHHHQDLGVELCYSCDFPLTDSSKVVSVPLANEAGDAKCCNALCASKVKQFIGAAE